MLVRFVVMSPDSVVGLHLPLAVRVNGRYGTENWRRYGSENWLQLETMTR